MWLRIKQKIGDRIRKSAYTNEFDNAIRELQRVSFLQERIELAHMFQEGITHRKKFRENNKTQSHEEYQYLDFVYNCIYRAKEPEKIFKSEFHQDCFVAGFLTHVRKGLCVEIGAADGIMCSNSFFLEKTLGWKCLLIEGCPEYWEKLKKNRPQNLIETTCISSEEGDVNFSLGVEGSYLVSGIENHFTAEHRNTFKFSHKMMRVPSLRFETVFKKHNITHIDYLSLDTENSELDCLMSIDFQTVHISLIGVEINYPEKQFDPIYKLLDSHGYKYVRRLFNDCFFYKPPVSKVLKLQLTTGIQGLR